MPKVVVLSGYLIRDPDTVEHNCLEKVGASSSGPTAPAVADEPKKQEAPAGSKAAEAASKTPTTATDSAQRPRRFTARMSAPGTPKTPILKVKGAGSPTPKVMGVGSPTPKLMGAGSPPPSSCGRPTRAAAPHFNAQDKPAGSASSSAKKAGTAPGKSSGTPAKTRTGSKDSGTSSSSGRKSTTTSGSEPLTTRSGKVIAAAQRVAGK